MTSLDEVRARFARNDGLPFAEILTQARILDASTSTASGTGTGV